jgi:hypothetical protein
VKLLVEEDGSEFAAALWDGCDAAVSSRLAYPEVRAALAAAGRAGRLTDADRRRAEAAWESYWSATRAVELTDAVTVRAGRLATEQALRGADAVHLASALAVSRTEVVLAVWDHRLRAGAQSCGLAIAPRPEESFGADRGRFTVPEDFNEPLPAKTEESPGWSNEAAVRPSERCGPGSRAWP